jgi:alkanesulfonate monooxygenase SsuD/methylene tetrahydromethanopterin reductase-like flavin-dependent oxidoreductase (luciferase family)
LLSYSNIDHHGPYYRFKNVTVSPRSIQDPCPPIWLASWGSPAGMRRVARFGDGWVASAWHSTPEEFRVSLGLLNSALDRRGRAPESFPNAVDTMFMYIAEDEKGAREWRHPLLREPRALHLMAIAGTIWWVAIRSVKLLYRDGWRQAPIKSASGR